LYGNEPVMKKFEKFRYLSAGPQLDLWSQRAKNPSPTIPKPASTRARISWAQLLKRGFAIDITTCPQCGGPLTLIAAIEEPAVIAKILAHLGVPTRAPPKTPARLDAFMQTA
jgi:hypothetical protein